MLRLLASVLLLGTTSALPAGAHQIESALTYLKGNLELSSSFSNGEPTQGAVVRLLNPDGTPQRELGSTDANGRWLIDLSDVADGVLDLQVDGGPGHRDYLELPVNSGQVDLDQGVSLPLSLVLGGRRAHARRRSDWTPQWPPAAAVTPSPGWLTSWLARRIPSDGMNTSSGWPRS